MTDDPRIATVRRLISRLRTGLAVVDRGVGRAERGVGTARAGNRRFGLFSALRAHTKAPYQTDSLWKTRRALNRPGRARTGGVLRGRVLEVRVEQRLDLPQRLPHVFLLLQLRREVLLQLARQLDIVLHCPGRKTPQRAGKRPNAPIQEDRRKRIYCGEC
jgi:hypothetical protein